jgi:hypothetical protein
MHFLQYDQPQYSENEETTLALQNLKGISHKANKYFWSAEYLAKTAQQKQAELWAEITSDTSSGKFPSALELPGVFVESMEPTFTGKGDAMPSGALYGSRTKYIHSVGTVGKVKFVPVAGQPYSGIFKGANYGLVRFSSAAAPSSSQPLAPGLGLKFLRDGTDSANLVSMWGVDGQPGDWNFFSNHFFTHIGAPSPSNVALAALSKKFSTATDFIQEVGLSDFAGFDQSGHQESPNNFPFSLTFVPNSDVSGLFPTDLGDKNYMKYVDQLKSVPANSRLYDIYAIDKSALAGGV